MKGVYSILRIIQSQVAAKPTMCRSCNVLWESGMLPHVKRAYGIEDIATIQQPSYTSTCWLCSVGSICYEPFGQLYQTVPVSLTLSMRNPLSEPAIVCHSLLSLYSESLGEYSCISHECRCIDSGTMVFTAWGIDMRCGVSTSIRQYACTYVLSTRGFARDDPTSQL